MSEKKIGRGGESSERARASLNSSPSPCRCGQQTSHPPFSLVALRQKKTHLPSLGPSAKFRDRPFFLA